MVDKKHNTAISIALMVVGTAMICFGLLSLRDLWAAFWTFVYALILVMGVGLIAKGARMTQG